MDIYIYSWQKSARLASAVFSADQTYLYACEQFFFFLIFSMCPEKKMDDKQKLLKHCIE